ncbi:MAG TPA: hypothetical protein VNZ06_09260 [Steroidobacteraceae bacterium]|jgi:hypothetical protein|nr:hypothetical protein [Steroidobacteraceae bacterium]
MKETITTAVLLVLATGPALADITTQESMALDAAGIVKLHGTTTEMTADDRQRRDSEFHCEGFMSLLCGNAKSGEIIRLDKDLTWQLRPDKKTYLETAFPTPEERAMAQQKMQETLDKMKQCQQQQAPRGAPSKGDTSNCDLSPPKVDMRTTDEHATIAGHDARKSSVKMSQTCTDKKTGDICEMVYGFDIWMTQDPLEGTADKRAFQKAYLTKMGLDANSPQIKGIAQQFMAAYSGTLKDMQAKAASLKGYPLRTTFRLIMGGDNCSKSKQSDSDNGAGAGGGGLSGLAANAGGKLLGGLFAKKNAAGANDPSQGAIAANAPPPLPDSYVQVIAFTIETSAVSTAAVSADQFELPAGWTREYPKAAKNSEYSCPNNKDK